MVACLPPSKCNPPHAAFHPPSTNRRSSLNTYPPPSSSTTRQHPQEPLILLHLGNCSNFNHLKTIHARIIRSSFFFTPPHHLRYHFLLRKLLHLSFSFRRFQYASRIFLYHVHFLSVDTFTWNLMIRSYNTHGYPFESLILFNLIVSRGFPPPDKFTFPFVIKACCSAPCISKGKEVHALAIKTGHSNDTFLYNVLMHFYFKSGDVVSARQVFDKMPVRSVVSWTTFVAGLVASGLLDVAQTAFDQMPTRNVVSWTAMIDGYVRHKRPQEAFELFSRMQFDKVRPNELTLVTLLRASIQLGSLSLGSWIHDYALKNGFRLGPFFGTALVDMYSKCGSLSDAKQVFDNMVTKNVATWNAMITSLGVHGYGNEALALFERMEEGNVRPDAITFVGVLCACSQMNDVNLANTYFKHMIEHYNIKPIWEHYTCLLELYNRNMSNEVHQSVNAILTNEDVA